MVNYCRNVLVGDYKGVGSVGRTGVLLKKLLGFKIVKIDNLSGKVLRDPKTGLCINCLPREVGELLGYINSADPKTTFFGYTSHQDTERKLIHSVANHGDAYFRTGDLFYMNEEFRLFFVDRIGDT